MQLAVRYAEHPNDMKGYETREMRNHFLFDQVFIEDEKRGWAVHRERSAGGDLYP
jgi:5-keto 4-deoxyuronate isomerase